MARKPRKAKPEAAAPPLLYPCPKCGFKVQRGRNPDKLAWHECRHGVEQRAAALLESNDRLDIEAARDVMVRALLQTISNGGAPMAQVAAALKVIEGSGRVSSDGGGLTPEFRRWAMGPRPA